MVLLFFLLQKVFCNAQKILNLFLHEQCQKSQRILGLRKNSEDKPNMLFFNEYKTKT